MANQFSSLSLSPFYTHTHTHTLTTTFTVMQILDYFMTADTVFWRLSQPKNKSGRHFFLSAAAITIVSVAATA